MIILFLITFLLLVVGMKTTLRGYYDDYLGRTQCDAIKGFFIIIVFIRHVFPYLKDMGYANKMTGDNLFLCINSHIGQLLVVMFLFYSGYGIMESVKNKGVSYIASFPRRRLLTTLLNFDVAVVIFILFDLMLGIKVTPLQCALSLTGWDSVGNSNWYIFIILVCYAVSYVCCLLFHRPNRQATATMVMLFAIMVALSMVKRNWWYNTILCYPFGMIYSAHKDKIEPFVKSHYFKVLFTAFSIFLVFHLKPLPYIYNHAYNLESMVFALIVVLLTLKIKTGNTFLNWMGRNLFPIYIYQRLPMIFLAEAVAPSFWLCHPLAYVSASFILTCVITWFYHLWCISPTPKGFKIG